MKLLILLLISNSAIASNETEAIRKASLALYKQSGLERDVDRKASQYKDYILSRDVQNYVANSTVLMQTVIEQRFTYEWRF